MVSVLDQLKKVTTVVADTGPLYALIDQADTWHARVVAWWGAEPRRVVIPVTVLLPETYKRRLADNAETIIEKTDHDTTTTPRKEAMK